MSDEYMEVPGELLIDVIDLYVNLYETWRKIGITMTVGFAIAASVVLTLLIWMGWGGICQ